MKKIAFAAASFALPLVAFAAGEALRDLIGLTQDILNSLIPLLIAAALVVFFYGLVKYILSGGENRAEGYNIMIAGLVSLFIMVSVWGIIRVLQNTLGISSDRGSVTIPTVPPRGN